MFHWLIFITLLFGKTPLPEEVAWQKWQKENYKEALSSPTSFLNAISLVQAQKGETLYLVAGASKDQTRWVHDKPKAFVAEVANIGQKIRVSIHGRTLKYLTKKKPQHSFELENGLFTKVYMGQRHQKTWAYLYDPNQIKQFTGFRFYPFNPRAITEGVFKQHRPKVVSYKTFQGDQTTVSKVGNVSFKLFGKDHYLSAYSWKKSREPMNYIVLVYYDKKAGLETYAGGRELVVNFNKPIRDGQKFTLDFNRTVNFLCAHSPLWHCPIGLQELLPVETLAGEMLPFKKIGSADNSSRF